MVIIARFGFSKALLSTTQPPHQKSEPDWHSGGQYASELAIANTSIL
jgi:hypothetical protein